MTLATCSIAGCGRPLWARGWCKAHYDRWWTRGDLRADVPVGPYRDPGCAVDGCDRPRYRARTVCNTHYMRQYRYGDLRSRQPVTKRCIEPGCEAKTRPHIIRCKPHFIEYARRRPPPPRVCGYGSAHQRVSRRRGPARDHSCVDCGAPARHWSYDHADLGELTAPEGRYSLDPRHYQARCVPCHKLTDLHSERSAAHARTA